MATEVDVAKVVHCSVFSSKNRLFEYHLSCPSGNKIKARSRTEVSVGEIVSFHNIAGKAAKIRKASQSNVKKYHQMVNDHQKCQEHERQRQQAVKKLAKKSNNTTNKTPIVRAMGSGKSKNKTKKSKQNNKKAKHNTKGGKKKTIAITKEKNSKTQNIKRNTNVNCSNVVESKTKETNKEESKSENINASTPANDNTANESSDAAGKHKSIQDETKVSNLISTAQAESQSDIHIDALTTRSMDGDTILSETNKQPKASEDENGDSNIESYQGICDIFAMFEKRNTVYR